ncbi:hypothetical protein CHARACLAT_013160 [Characodon lateralis]|uniref:Uncharacterized protein n=1 Tax=Characodon lateralis TaxID=208331 RepID=A0ABU7E059_9TELE|nr:hypothetical protein [Characodon lateralis]
MAGRAKLPDWLTPAPDSTHRSRLKEENAVIEVTSRIDHHAPTPAVSQSASAIFVTQLGEMLGGNTQRTSLSSAPPSSSSSPPGCCCLSEEEEEEGSGWRSQGKEKHEEMEEICF